jgi:hypothetical protein
MKSKKKSKGRLPVLEETTTLSAFQTAVENTPDVATCFQVGLRALGQHSQKIALDDTSLCEGSLDIDGCTTRLYPNENRWDYALSYNSEVFFVEVHTANTTEVSTVLRKLQWLKDWLVSEAPEINALKATKHFPYYWIQSSGFDILKTSPQYRRIVQAGLKPIARLNL